MASVNVNGSKLINKINYIFFVHYFFSFTGQYSTKIIGYNIFMSCVDLSIDATHTHILTVDFYSVHPLLFSKHNSKTINGSKIDINCSHYDDQIEKKDMGNYCSLSNHRQMTRSMDDNMLRVKVFIIIFHARYKKGALSDTFDILIALKRYLYLPRNVWS